MTMITQNSAQTEFHMDFGIIDSFRHEKKYGDLFISEYMEKSVVQNIVTDVVCVCEWYRKPLN